MMRLFAAPSGERSRETERRARRGVGEGAFQPNGVTPLQG
jgi:hypothetical protein